MKVDTTSEITSTPTTYDPPALSIKGYDSLSVLTRDVKLITANLAPVPLRITLKGSDGTQSLFIVDKGTVTFEGNPDTAAQAFIDRVIRRQAEQWLALERRAQAAEAELAKYTGHNALMTISHQLVAAHRELEALRREIALNRGNHYSEQTIHCNQQCADCGKEAAKGLVSEPFQLVSNGPSFVLLNSGGKHEAGQ